MLAIDTQLKQAYEEGNLTPEEIAQEQGLDLVAVKAKLMQISIKYREDAKGEKAEQNNFDENEDALAKQVILESMTSAERADGSVDHKTRLAAAIYLRDDKRGRHDKKLNAPSGFNMIQFNQMITDARSSSERFIQETVGGQRSIEV